MCKLMDDLVNDVVKDAVKDRNLDIAKKFIALGKLPLEDIARASDLPLSTVEELASSIEKKEQEGTGIRQSEENKKRVLARFLSFPVDDSALCKVVG